MIPSAGSPSSSSARLPAYRATCPSSSAYDASSKAAHAANRTLLLEGLPQLGVTELAPADGAFYVYADVGHLTADSMAFCHDLLARTGIAMAPGIDFDTEVGGRFVRMSFPGRAAVIEESLERLSTVL